MDTLDEILRFHGARSRDEQDTLRTDLISMDRASRSCGFCGTNFHEKSGHTHVGGLGGAVCEGAPQLDWIMDMEEQAAGR